jgi:hypothetical protein
LGPAVGKVLCQRLKPIESAQSRDPEHAPAVRNLGSQSAVGWTDRVVEVAPRVRKHASLAMAFAQTTARREPASQPPSLCVATAVAPIRPWATKIWGRSVSPGHPRDPWLELHPDVFDAVIATAIGSLPGVALLKDTQPGSFRQPQVVVHPFRDPCSRLGRQ